MRLWSRRKPENHAKRGEEKHHQAHRIPLHRRQRACRTAGTKPETRMPPGRTIAKLGTTPQQSARFTGNGNTQPATTGAITLKHTASGAKGKRERPRTPGPNRRFRKKPEQRNRDAFDLLAATGTVKETDSHMTAGRNNAESLSNHWCTPPKYVDAVREFFSGTIALDPCSGDYSIVGAEVELQLPKTDGLAVPWNHKTIFVNPPYGADRKRKTTIKDWLGKCSKSHSEYGSEILALVPVATNTGHWKLHVWKTATCVAFLYDTRLKFLINGQRQNKGAPMSCAMVYWGHHPERFHEVFIPFGAVVDVRRCREITQATEQRLLLNPQRHTSR